ncbi:exo-alpha-sialidase [Mucilaginibacter paludis]|uniref:Sialidase domain-containing protein n=1 Tax=Mucilaginibacter paludis DSM 18603 TaxID=714943 RepID=H1YC84_9SPHI|nr:sialidase family protein [Mucilaginibacter paludis]EHQ30075.1 hypothetical protein Mucpa_6016 [Mucilaginibacter paludis DSM 18603]
MKQFKLCFLLFFVLFSCKKNEVTINNTSPPVADSGGKVSPIPPINPNDTTIFSDGSSTEPLEGRILIKQKTNPAFLNRIWQGVPTITADNNNNLFAAWYSGYKSEGPGNYITVSVSKDLGKSWLDNEAIITPNANTLIRFFDACLWTDPHGHVYLFWGKVKSKLLWDGRGGVWYSRLSFVNDSLKFDTPKRLSDGIMMNKPICINNNADIIFPISVWRDAPTQAGLDGAFIYKASFAIKNSFAKLSNLPAVEPATGDNIEHMVTDLGNGHLFALTRTGAGNNAGNIQYSNSYDNGNSWDTIRAFKKIFPNAASRVFIRKLKSGNILLIINNSWYRTNLTVFLSVNNGVSWKYKTVLVANDIVASPSYPDAVQTTDGVIHMVNDADRYGAGLINHTSFTEQDIMTGDINSFYKSTVSRK